MGEEEAGKYLAEEPAAWYHQHGLNRLEAIYTSEVSLKLLSTFAATLTAAVLLVNVPAVAQDEGKTAAAELTADSQGALAALVATVPLA